MLFCIVSAATYLDEELASPNLPKGITLSIFWATLLILCVTKGAAFFSIVPILYLMSSQSSLKLMHIRELKMGQLLVLLINKELLDQLVWLVLQHMVAPSSHT